VGVNSLANIRALKAVLIQFEAVSGMKVNFHKSMLSGLMSLTLGCMQLFRCYIVDMVHFLFFT